MITNIEAIVEQGGSIDQYTTLDLSLLHPENGFVIRGIEGLDPVAASVSSSSFAAIDGEQYHSSRRNKRNIILKLDIRPEYTSLTVGELRAQLYSFFMPKNNVRLRFFLEGQSDTRIIYGRVESFVAPLFTQTPQVTVSLLCFDPDFKDLNTKLLSGNSTSSTTELFIDYSGNVESGIELRVNVNRDISGFDMYLRSRNDVLKTMSFTEPLIAGDVLKISTVAGDKSVSRLRSSNWSSRLYGLTPSSDWLKLFPGLNFVRLHIPGDPMPYTIEYLNRYGGF